MIKVEFFKKDTTVYAIINNNVVELFVKDVSIQTQPDLVITYFLGKKDSEVIYHRLESNFVFETPELLLDNIKNQIKALKNDK